MRLQMKATFVRMELPARGSTPGKPIGAPFDTAASHRLAPLGLAPIEKSRVRAWARRLLQRRVRPYALLGETVDAVQRAVVGGRATW